MIRCTVCLGFLTAVCLTPVAAGEWNGRPPRGCIVPQAVARMGHRGDTLLDGFLQPSASTGSVYSAARDLQIRDIRLGVRPGRPGYRDRLRLYVPSGRHAPHSLPCVLVAPAGGSLLTGREMSEADHVWHLPYVRAGFAVVVYEVDRPVADAPDATHSEFILVASAAAPKLVW